MHLFFVGLSVTLSTKSTKFSIRYIVDRLKGTKFGRLIEGALLYISARIGELALGDPMAPKY